jgi:stearoyl-CoA 9-desaturase NADPH oxidoreductase
MYTQIFQDTLMTQLGQIKSLTTPASFYRWASRIPSTTLKSHLDFLLNEFDPLFGMQRLAAEVVEIVDETEEVKTYVLRPSIYWKGFLPGQYVSIELDINGVRTRRNYSISSSLSMFERQGLVSITVKSVEGGLVSNHLPNALHIGSLLHLSEARGEFVREATQGKDQPAPLFIAAGSGITPVMAMIEAMAEASTLDTAVLIYVVRCKEELIFDQQLSALAQANSGFRYITHFSSSKRDHLNQSKLLNYCPDISERTLYTCGPEGFMNIVKQSAASLGLDEQAIRSESFGLPRRNAAADRLSLAAKDSDGKAKTVLVSLTKAQKVLESSGTKTLLELAEQAGLNPKYGCRSGICHECKCLKSSGRVMNTLTGELVPEEQTHIQACISIPVDDVSIESW